MQIWLRILLMVGFIFFSKDSFAQQGAIGGKSGIIKGRLISSATKQPAADVQVLIPFLKQLGNTDAEGVFTFSSVPFGTYSIVIGGAFFSRDTMKVSIHDAVADLGDITITPNDSNTSVQSLLIPTIALEDNNISADDDGVKTSTVSGLLSAARDPFTSTAAYVFGPYRFQPRGYSRSSQEVLINGSPMNDVETGNAFWGQWGGLNDVFRSRTNTYGLKPSEYSFGGINGTTYFDASATSQRKQTKITYSLTNRSYRDRLVFTKSSGLQKNGWAYSLSVSKRWANEGLVSGTFYDGYSYYGAVSKRFNGGKHEWNLITFGAPTLRGKSAPVTQEAQDLSGDKIYNPNWGLQNGVVRNAKVANQFQPNTIFSYEYTPNNTFKWETSLGYQFGKNKNSALDYYNGSSPRPDYYKYMPSYLRLNGENPADALFYENKQIMWDNLIAANRINLESVKDANGILGNTISGNRSIYVVYNDVDAVNKFTLNTNLSKAINEHISLTTGIQFISQKTESYRELSDLLGGDYYLNINQFARQDFGPSNTYNQYDINIPNRIIHQGDKYNYDYISHFTKGSLWGQGVFTYNKLDFFAAARIGYNDFSREGLYKNGLFPTSSMGLGSVHRFSTFSVKGGVTYKMDGRNFFFVNAAIGQEAPTVDNTYISARSRDLTIDNPTVEKISSIEGGYIKRTPKYNLRAVAFATDIKDANEIKRYYSDFTSSFVNYVMKGISTRNTGLELAAEVKFSPALSVTAVAAISQAFYTNNPASVGIYNDIDSASIPVSHDVYIKNYYLAAGPQSAYSLGFNYRSKKYWYANVNFSYFDRNYVDISPDQRSEAAIAGVVVGSSQWHRILDQQVLPSVFSVDLSGGKSFLLSKYSKSFPRNTFLYLNIGISNLLNTPMKTGGFEQLRYNFSNFNPDKFDTKYFYGLGRNFFINLSLKF